MALDLASLAQEAWARGWARGEGLMADVRILARALGWKEVATRQGEDPLAELRPVDNAQAPPRSLSARYGTGSQPLHVDGAHLERPPDLIVLSAAEPSTTSTVTWSPFTPTAEGWSPRKDMPVDAFEHGLFLVSPGRGSFLSSALPEPSVLRFDPGCMAPGDERARIVVEYLRQAVVQAEVHEWSAPGQLLVINNHRMVHARGAVPSTGFERLIHRLTFRTGATS